MEARSVEELTQLELQVVSLPVDAIDYEPGNPNEIEPATYETLKADIRDQGFVQPILVRPDGERWRMVDGEHRHRIVSELGYATIPAVVIEADEDESKLRLLTTNKLRGEFVPLAYAYMLADLTRVFPEAELRRRLGMDESEFRDALRLTDFTDDVSDTLREEIEREAAEAPRVLRFVMATRDAELVERVVGSVVDSKVDRGQALARICRFYEAQHKET